MALETNFGEAGREAMLLTGHRQPRASTSGGLGRLNLYCPYNSSISAGSEAGLTFAFAAASSFSSHVFSVTLKASTVFQFFLRRSCQDHTCRAISHTSPQRLLGGTTEDFKASTHALVEGLLSQCPHAPFPFHLCSAPVHHITQVTVLREHIRGGLRQQLPRSSPQDA